MPVIIQQTHTLDADQVKAMLAAHYQANGVPVVPSNISHRVHDGGGSGFSHSGPSLGDTVIHFHGQKRVLGMPDSITLRPEQIQEIAAAFFTDALGFSISPSSVQIDVSGSGGSGFSSHGAHLNSISVRSRRTIG